MASPHQIEKIIKDLFLFRVFWFFNFDQWFNLFQLLLTDTLNIQQIFEYLTSSRPVLSIGPPDGEAARILKETNTGTTVDPDDQETLKKTILDLFAAYKKGRLMTEPRNLENFSRKTLTQKMTAVFSGCLEKQKVSDERDLS